MDKLKIQITYKGKRYAFEDGLKAYIFDIGVQNKLDKKYGMKALLKYVDLVANCVYVDTNETVVVDFATYVSSRWKLLEDMDRGELLEFYYENKIY